MMNKTALPLALISLAAWVNSAAAADPEAGQKIFARCAVCHEVETKRHKMGPTLSGVIGRTPGTASQYKYSSAMQAFGDGRIWDRETLAIYLSSPRKVVKNTRMAFPGLKNPDDVANVISYIAKFSD